MSDPKTRVEPADAEAAAWHARLAARSVSSETIDAFFAWRSDPGNSEAYKRIGRIWSDAGALSDDPRIQAALEDAMSRRRPATSPRLPRSLLGLAAVGAAAVLAFGGWSWWEGRGVFETSVGEQRVVQLTDGSAVRLDTGSRIRVRFDGGRRFIALERGQALFTVAHDTARPFVVAAGDARVTAVGTVFDVRRNPGDVRVTLVSGVVDVANGAGAPAARMTAGHQARVTPAAVRTRAVDAATETGWSEGRIVFRDTPLSQAVVEVNRYLTTGIELRAGSLSQTPINGVFRAGDRDAFVSTASEGLGLAVSRGADGSVILSERTNN